jgi:hypothetical protein
VPTLGAVNAGTRVGPAVISEVQFHPAFPTAAALAVAPSLGSADLEYVEISNPTNSPLVMTGWSLRGGIDFDFAAATTITAGAALLVVSFDPDDPNNAQLLSGFRAHYGLDNSTLIVGSDGVVLSNAFDRVQLQRPGVGLPIPGGPLWVDEVVYDDVAPWPTAADGTGASLQRVAADSHGNLATSWFAATPSPGVPSFGTPPGDFNGDGVLDDTDIDLLFQQLRSPTPDLAFDLTGDGSLDEADRDHMILSSLGTTYGDANLDRIFNSADLIQVLAAGKYEDNVPGNAGWAEGDWNGDGDFGTGDLVLALQQGGYVAAARPIVAATLDVRAAAAALQASVSTATPQSDKHHEGQNQSADKTRPRVELLPMAVESLFSI